MVDISTYDFEPLVAQYWIKMNDDKSKAEWKKANKVREGEWNWDKQWHNANIALVLWDATKDIDFEMLAILEALI